MTTGLLLCDGCGQPASPEHIARRLQRLEWTTRYRPVHISAILLGGVSPVQEADFLYAGRFEGEAARLLRAVGISLEGKPPETVLSEFQRSGFLLTHVLECPLDDAREAKRPSMESLLVQRLPSVMARIRRSLKPKRVVLISEELGPVSDKFLTSDLGCTLLLDGGKPFSLDGSSSDAASQRLREALAAPVAVR